MGDVQRDKPRTTRLEFVSGEFATAILGFEIEGQMGIGHAAIVEFGDNMGGQNLDHSVARSRQRPRQVRDARSRDSAPRQPFQRS